MIRRLSLSAMVFALALGGCAVGPRYTPPPALKTGAFQAASSAVDPSRPAPDAWWRLFDDQGLDAIVAEALEKNTDLRAAEAHLAYAQGLLAESRAGLLPQTTVTGGSSFGRSALSDFASAAAGESPRNGWGYSAGLNAAYQVDLFGRLRRSIEAARADAQAQRDTRDAVAVTVAAEAASAYARACGAGLEAKIAERSADIAAQTYGIVAHERDIGAASDFDVARARAAMEAAAAAAPVYAGARQTALFELAALMGRTPDKVPEAAKACQAPPLVGQPLPVGDGAALLRRRPDVRAAERSLAASTARVGVALTEYLPTVSLGGTLASGAGSLKGLGQPAGVTLSLGPLISWSFPNVALAQAHSAEARANAAAALAEYDGAVLVALKEGETALAVYGGDLQSQARLSAAQDAADTAEALARASYGAGSASLLDLLSAEGAAAQARGASAAAGLQAAEDQVAVFKALGGGWEAHAAGR